jgi:signal peptidase I
LKIAKLPSWFFYCLASVALGGAALILLAKRVTVEVPMRDNSMRPAITPDRTQFTVDPSWVGNPARLDIVAFLPPGAKSGKARVARAVALPGDKVEVRNHRLHVNGKLVTESKRELPAFAVPETRVPRDCVYLLVDSEKGEDSGVFGPLPLWRVTGRLEL